MPQTTPTTWIHPKYAPLISAPCRYFLVTGGRGSGKSFGVAALLITLLCDTGQRVLYTRYTMAAAETSIIPEFTEKIDLLGMSPYFVTKQREIINTQTGSSILFSGIKESSGNQTAKLKSLTGITTWVLDEAEELDDETVFDKIDMSVRSMSAQNRIILVMNPAWKSHWIYKRFYEPFSIPDEFNGIRGSICYIHTTYEDNLRNLPPDILSITEERRRNSPAKYLHIDRGHWAENVEGALWTADLISASRVWQHPPLTRIVTAVDPAVSANADSDETGIVTAGIDAAGDIYILADNSLTASPLRWAQAAVAAYRAHSADRIVAETNQGGDLVETTLRTVDRNIPYTPVRATRGKFLRAEPIAALYESGRVHHVGTFPELEDQMTRWTPSADYSPDRMDALVWACTALTANTPAYQTPIIL